MMFRPRTLFWILLAAIVVAALWRRLNRPAAPPSPASGAAAPRPVTPPPASRDNGIQGTSGTSNASAGTSGPRRITTRVHRGAPPSVHQRPAETAPAPADTGDAAEAAAGTGPAAAPEPAAPSEPPAVPESAATPDDTRVAPASDENTADAAALPCNINQATLDELVALPGIGPALAARIVAYRSEHGPFTSVEALLDIQGIGPQNLQEFAHLITVDE